MTKKQQEALEIYDEITKLSANAGCELNYRKDFELLIAIMLSAQTTDQSVNKVTDKLFKKYNNLDEISKASLEQLENELRKLGLFRNKAKNQQKMAKKIFEKNF